MSRSTIDFGIDLGTTNSAVGMLEGTGVRLFRNAEGQEYTPSAVWMDRKDKLWVGRRAKERLEDDAENAHSEFKLQLGTEHPFQFARSGRTMLPQELSAEVLKSLKASVQNAIGEDIQAAVITVPAAFEFPQCDATRRAAELAGLTRSPLLQEPVAAALTYGFQSESEKVFWLVFDMGGGTFDAAVVQVRDGAIQVVNHGGDNHLGGKLIDWAIVDQLFVPALAAEHPLTDFRRGNPKWHKAFQTMKSKAEQAKILLSQEPTADIWEESLCVDDGGAVVEFEYELRREDLERLAEPFILRAINIAKKVLEQKRLGSGDIERAIMVGGPSLMGYLRERLSDPHEGLGIPLEFNVDPLTVVAQGAAIFAGTQRLTTGAPTVSKPNEYAIDLEYNPVGADEEPLVAGKVGADGSGVAGFTVEFINSDARPPWRSGKIGLAPNGTFMTNLWAEKGHPNVYTIELCDGKGTQVDAVPDTLTYTIGMVTSEQPLIHSMGVALASGEVQLFFEKGTPLPVRRRSIHRTAVDATRGQEGSLITIPVVEGENTRRADRNQLVGKLEITGQQIKRDIPAGSEVEITIEVDESRLVRAMAYIPVVDEEFEEVIQLGKVAPDPKWLQEEIDREKKRLETMRGNVGKMPDAQAREALQRIDRERMEHDLDASMAAARDDRDAADKAQKRLLDLRQALDDAEDALEWPSLVEEAEEALKTGRQVITEHGDATDKQSLAALEREMKQAMETRDPDLLRRRIGEVTGLKMRVLQEQPVFWVGLLQFLEQRIDTMKDREQAEQILTQGQRALKNNDVPGLKAACQQLLALLPAEGQEAVRSGFGSTVL